MREGERGQERKRERERGEKREGERVTDSVTKTARVRERERESKEKAYICCKACAMAMPSLSSSGELWAASSSKVCS